MATPSNNEVRQNSQIYVRRQAFQTGGISVSASALSEADISALEASLLGVPLFPDVQLNITLEEIDLMSMMLNHIIIALPNSPKRSLHVNSVFLMASQLSGKEISDLTQDECLSIIETTLEDFRSIRCNCRAHRRLKEIKKEDFDLANLLASLNELDVRESFKDQSGAQCLTDILNFLARRQKWLLNRCYSKSAGLQVSCVMYNAEKNEVKLINATPDFVMKSGKEDGSSEILSVGEIESSPYVQMITASLGHISTPFIKYLLGICVSKEKTVNLYLIHNKLGLKVHTDEAYVSDIEVKTVSTEVYSFTSVERLHNLKKIVSIITFIYDDYETRINEFDWPTSIPEDPKPVLRQSERKRKGSRSPTPGKCRSLMKAFTSVFISFN